MCQLLHLLVSIMAQPFNQDNNSAINWTRETIMAQPSNQDNHSAINLTWKTI